MGFGAVRRQISTTLSGRSLGFRGPGGKGKSHLTGPVGRVGDWRPRIDREVEGLIIRMAEENRSWGYDRIVGALANLGHEVSDQTVGNVLRRHGIPPARERKRRTTWAEFIWIHLALLAGTDISAAEVVPIAFVTSLGSSPKSGRSLPRRRESASEAHCLARLGPGAAFFA